MAETNARRLHAHLQSMTRPYTEDGFRFSDIEAQPFDAPVHPSTDSRIVFRMRVRQGTNDNAPIMLDSYDPSEKVFDYLYVVNPRTYVSDGTDAEGNHINKREDMTAAIRIELRRFLDSKLGHTNA